MLHVVRQIADTQVFKISADFEHRLLPIAANKVRQIKAVTLAKKDVS
jgi:hypothetical protein